MDQFPGAAWYAPPTNWAEVARESDPDWPAVASDGMLDLPPVTIPKPPADDEIMHPIVEDAMRDDA